MKATDLLRNDHQTVKTLFAEFEGAGSADERADIFEDVREQLDVHTTVEEEIFYPAVGRVSKEGKAEAEKAADQHQTVKNLLETLDRMDPEDDEFADTMMRLARIVDDHVQMEEEIIFVTVEEMSDERLSELGSQLQRRKDELLEEGDIIPDEESASR